MFNGYKAHGMELSETLKNVMFIGDYVHQNHGPYHYAKASTAICNISKEYNYILDNYDVFIMPTLPNTPCKIPKEDASIKEKIEKALNMVSNTAIFDATGHPALSLNCGFDKELPVGLMIVGKHYDEVGVLNAGSIFESVLYKHM